MEWRLWDEAVWCRQAEDTGDTGGDTKEEDVPVKTGRLSEREFCTLGD